MDFLKSIFGEKAMTFDEFVQAINAHNGNDANKDNLIKLANLTSGEYVAKGKYDSLNDLLTGKQTELETANNLITELQKGTKGNEDLQSKITAYEQEKEQLQEQLQETKITSALKVALLSEKAVDVDYLTYKLKEKLKEKNEKLELDENDNIKGWNDMLSGLKVKFPSMFEGAGSGGMKILEPNKLPEHNKDRTVTKEQFSKMTYEERVRLKQDNEQLYRNLSGKN